MNVSFLCTSKSRFDPTEISLIALPNWLKVFLRAREKTLEDLWNEDPQSVWNILSGRDVMFHDNVTASLNDALFGQYSYDSTLPGAVEKREKLKDMWDAVPFETHSDFVLHPVICGSNLIAIVRLTGEEAAQAAETSIYERLLKCYHKLATAQLGTQVWDTPLARAILEHIQSQASAA